jgi:hypothetical protein
MRTRSVAMAMLATLIALTGCTGDSEPSAAEPSALAPSGALPSLTEADRAACAAYRVWDDAAQAHADTITERPAWGPVESSLRQDGDALSSIAAAASLGGELQSQLTQAAQAYESLASTAATQPEVLRPLQADATAVAFATGEVAKICQDGTVAAATSIRFPAAVLSAPLR